MVVVMTTRGFCISLMSTMRSRELPILMVVMMSMRLGTLPTANRCTTTRAVIITFTVIILCLPAFTSSGLHNWLWSMLVGCIILASCQGCVGMWNLRAGNWTRSTDTAYAASYAGEHTAEFTLNPRLVGRSLKLWLRALNGLWQGRYPALPVHLLNVEQASWLTIMRRSILDRTPCIEEARTGTTVISD